MKQKLIVIFLISLPHHRPLFCMHQSLRLFTTKISSFFKSKSPQKNDPYELGENPPAKNLALYVKKLPGDIQSLLLHYLCCTIEQKGSFKELNAIKKKHKDLRTLAYLLHKKNVLSATNYEAVIAIDNSLIALLSAKITINNDPLRLKNLHKKIVIGTQHYKKKLFSLISKGFLNPNLITSEQESDFIEQTTPLFIAINYHQDDYLSLLLQHGADVNRNCFEKKIGNEIYQAETPLTLAINTFNFDDAQTILDYGANPNKPNIRLNKPYEYPLHLTIYHTNVASYPFIENWQIISLLEKLIKKGADRTLQNSDGFAPLQLLEKNF